MLHYDEIQKNGKESTASEDSHNAGQNCMRCHHDERNEASGTGTWWYFAGTAYTSNGSVVKSGGVVELWSEAGGKGNLIYKVPIDKAGNFYTSKIIDLRGGFFPRIISNNGQDTSMSQKATGLVDGACNNCHGISTNKIVIK
jgi:hypothetical protein